MKLEFKQEFQKFIDHLNLPYNDRIIFSAPFGIGKTTFLKDFFAMFDDYEVFHIFPANYSVSENDNIFEYIKYDILYQLIEKTDAEYEEFSYTQTLQSFLVNFGEKLIPPFIAGLSTLNKEVTNIYNILYAYFKLGNEYLKYHKDIQHDDLVIIDKFRNEIEAKVGSIYEQNFITNLIKYNIAKISESNDYKIKKQAVLIIDDLDRIDPDHFFRIMNIFAAHVDQCGPPNGLKNKFGFHKVLFVFDKDNARNIFHYRYGPKVDYDGYLNKFYSITIFEFDPYPDIVNRLRIILSKIRVKDAYKKHFNFMDNSYLLTVFILHIIKTMLINKQINLRNLLKLLDKEHTFQTRALNLPHIKEKLANTSFLIIIAFDFMIELLGESKSLERALQASSKSSDFYADHDSKFNLLQHLIVLLDYKQHLFSGKREVNNFKIYEYEFHYNLIKSSNLIWARLNNEKGDPVQSLTIFDQINTININMLIYNSYLICKELKIYQ